jgi:hypothetical protein
MDDRWDEWPGKYSDIEKLLDLIMQEWALRT